MKRSDLIKLAKENKEVRDALLTITKTAGETTQFDETVPAVSGGQAQGTGAAPVQPGQPPAQAPVEAPAGAGPVPADQAALEMAGQGQVDPAAEGARAAREFLAPAFEAASQGDPNAQQTLAVAAGEVAKGVAMAAHQATGGEAPPAAAAAPAAIPATPEEQVADQVVAAPAEAKADATPEVEQKEDEEKTEGKDTTDKKSPFPKKKDEKKPEEKKPPFEKKSELMFSADTVRGLIQLAKANII